MTSQVTQAHTPNTGRSSDHSSLQEEQARRAGLYSVLAATLRDTPDAGILDFIAQLQDEPAVGKTELATALNLLALAAQHRDGAAIRDEFHNLFIGLGRGEVVPYGSWYQTGFLMEKPLSQLRDDLRRLGFARSEETHEPEDHIAALCEVMSLLIREQAPATVQRQFFEQHLGCWGGDFFRDLGKAESAVFYRSLARVGSAFLSLEDTYLSLPE